jgi:hypothetical protein
VFSQQAVPPPAGERRKRSRLAGGDEVVPRRTDAIEAWSRTVVVHLLWIGAGAAALALQFVRGFRGLYLSDAMDLAQIGRHLAAGDGYVTSLLRPAAIGLSHRLPAPELFHAPLHPLLLALVFGILPETDLVVAAVSAFFFAATLPLVYLLGAKLFDRATGVLAAVLFALSVSALGYAVSGLHVTLWAFLLTLVVYLLYTNPGSRRRSLAAGAVLGLCWLTEYLTIALVVPALIGAYYMQPERRRRHLAWFAVGLVVVMAPWWVRNLRVAGDPLFTLERYQLVMFTSAHPGYQLLRSADTSALKLPALVLDSARPLVKKTILGLASAYRILPPLVGLYVVAFFIIAMMRRLGAPRPDLARKTVFMLTAFMVAVGALHNPTAETFFVLVPVITVLCAGYFLALVREWIGTSRGRSVAVVLFAALAAYPVVVSWAAPQPKVLPSRANLDYLRGLVGEHAVVVSDAPWAVAWHARRLAVWLPLGGEDFEAVQKSIGVDAIYFSTLLSSYPASEQPLLWQRLYAGRTPPPGFEVAATLPPGELVLLKEESAAGERVGPPAPTSSDRP